ncbi:MAG: hypothetical protein ACM3NO_04020 [Deltaproteobacteria bacterium]
MNPLVPLIWIAGVVHVMLLLANAVVPQKLDYRRNLERVSPIIRQVFVLHTIFILLTVTAFAALCFFYAPALAAGTGVARAISGFIALYWLLRLTLQFLYVDKQTRRANRLGDWAYSLAIFSIGAVFALAATGMVK